MAKNKQGKKSNEKEVKSTKKEVKKETVDVKKVVIKDEIKVQKPKKKTVEFNKKDIEKVVITILIVIVFVLAIFFISNKISDCSFGNYCKKVEENNKNTNPLLANGEVLDETLMKELSEITYSEYQKALKDKKNQTVIYLSSDSSYWTQYETPILKSVAFEYNLDIKYLAYDKLSEKEIEEITKLDSNISKETPAVLIVKNKKLVASKTTPLTISNFVDFFNEQGVITKG